mmetsp:Transcript_27056/g.55232  ORF Transcript_27056/g.55232 Transcript_27056/m.55232 type:complete len:550 (+) Transcript_27056:122-1771(+)
MSQHQRASNGGTESGENVSAPVHVYLAENGGGNEGERVDREATKRLAQHGQWRTPPMPAFASTDTTSKPTTTHAGGTPANPGSVVSAVAPVMPRNLPTTPDEYARMLQEAYRRGAEAGARGKPKSASPPAVAPRAHNTQTVPNAQSSHTPGVNPSTAYAAKLHAHAQHQPAGMPPPPTVQYMAPPPIPSPLTTSMNGGAHAHPAGPSSAAVSHHVPMSTANYPTATAPVTSPMPSAASHNVHHAQYHHSIAPVTTASHPMAAAPAGVAAGNRSVSLPDISSYAAHANDEEEKRKKRLARNRASARLRRLKKKNLVDSYEGEVGILEAALSKLKAHRWGSSNPDSNNHDALIEALSMERGQQPLTPEKRSELIQSIIIQQREQVANLMECQLENWILSMLAESELGKDENGKNSQSNNVKSEDDNVLDPVDQELNELTAELQSVLQLSPDQLTRIQQSSRGCEREVQDLFTVDNCLESILSNQWLLDEGVDEVAGQFTSILNTSQLSKFLLWSDHNADAIEKLDYVNVGNGSEQGPVFEFGIDEGLEGGD